MDDIVSITAMYTINSQRIFATYRDCVSCIDEKIEKIDTDDTVHSQSSLENMREISDHAFFCLYYFQFERWIKDTLGFICDQRLEISDPVDRLAWKQVRNRTANMDVVEIIKLLIPDQPNFHKQIDHYKKTYRNKIVHQGNLTTEIDLGAIVAEMDDLASNIYMNILLFFDMSIRHGYPHTEATP